MHEPVVLGADPGTAYGAYAVVGVRTRTIYVVEQFVDWKTVYTNLHPLFPHFVGTVIERISSRPGEGRVGGCAFCANYGGWQAVAEMLQVPYELVVPIKWQAKIGGRLVKKNSKARIAEVCKEKWPIHSIWGCRNKKELYGYTDALGIALYATHLYS
jgi:hypothetical protein